MKIGDLVRWSKTKQIGIALDIFGDLDPVDPWVRVVFQKNDSQAFQWCKMSCLSLVKKEGAEIDPFLSGAVISGSGSL